LKNQFLIKDCRTKTKILLLAPYPSESVSGGIATWTKNILDYNVSTKNNTLELVFLPVIRSVFVAGCSKLARYIYGLKDYLVYIIRFKQLLKNELIDIVHNTTSASISLLKDIIIQNACIKKNIGYVIHFRLGTIPELYKKNNLEWKLIYYLVKHSTIAIVLDKATLKIFHDIGFTNVVLVPNLISIDVLNYIEQNKNIKREERKILFVGHLLPTKGIFELVEACVHINNINLILIGKIPNREIKELLLAIANKKDEKDWIKILDNQKHELIIKEMLSSSIFVLPTYTEGFPNVILEAMACGCSIVTTPVGAIPEMLNIFDLENRCGTAVEPKNVPSLVNAIEMYFNNKKIAIEHGKNAKSKALREYSIEVVWEQLMYIWKDVIIS
jgi:glycosyltransferase involved in cell wall biosynthesis